VGCRASEKRAWRGVRLFADTRPRRATARPRRARAALWGPHGETRVDDRAEGEARPSETPGLAGGAKRPAARSDRKRCAGRAAMQGERRRTAPKQARHGARRAPGCACRCGARGHTGINSGAAATRECWGRGEAGRWRAAGTLAARGQQRCGGARRGRVSANWKNLPCSAHARRWPRPAGLSLCAVHPLTSEECSRSSRCEVRGVRHISSRWRARARVQGDTASVEVLDLAVTRKGSRLVLV